MAQPPPPRTAPLQNRMPPTLCLRPQTRHRAPQPHCLCPRWKPSLPPLHLSSPLSPVSCCLPSRRPLCSSLPASLPRTRFHGSASPSSRVASSECPLAVVSPWLRCCAAESQCGPLAVGSSFGMSTSPCRLVNRRSAPRQEQIPAPSRCRRTVPTSLAPPPPPTTSPGASLGPGRVRSRAPCAA